MKNDKKVIEKARAQKVTRTSVSALIDAVQARLDAQEDTYEQWGVIADMLSQAARYATVLALKAKGA
jgi:hypothetical protein